jgi:copper chaperone CopZ
VSVIYQPLVSTALQPSPMRPKTQGPAAVCRAGPADETKEDTFMAELSFKVPQMSRGDCVTAITTALRRLDGVSGIEVDLHTKWVVVTGDWIDSEAIRRAVDQAGYKAEL